jgi:hypothetical protein
VGSNGIANDLRCPASRLCSTDVVLLPAVSTTPSNSSSVTKYQAETEAMSGLKEQQALTNSKLDSIRDELRALNQKAAGEASVAPPSTP